MFRVVYCFSFYREVHTALRSMVKLGHGDHEESQVHDLWLEDDYFSLTKFCSFIGDQSQIRSSCEKKSDAVFCGFCESTNHVVFNCPRKASVRSVFAFLALKHMIASGYWESIDFTPVLNAVISHDEQVPSFQDPSRHPPLPFPRLDQTTRAVLLWHGWRGARNILAFALGALKELPPKCSNSSFYAAANNQPIFHRLLAAVYTVIGRILALPSSYPISGHRLIRIPRTLLTRWYHLH